MNLIIIPCCGTKYPDGSPTYQPPVALTNVLDSSAYRQLMAARRELAQLLKLPLGPDLGFETQDTTLRFLPAYQRYNGIIYRTGRLHQLYRPGGTRKVTIISALYGLLDAADPIRDYNLAMSDSLTGQRLHTWWQRHGLGDIVCEYVMRLNPEAVFDLLSGAYRKALEPWPDHLQDSFPMKLFSYPGQGTGSKYRRGEDLARLLLS